jgi:deoxycytidylate deaminase
MHTSNQAQNIQSTSTCLELGKSARSKIRNTLTDELIFAICAPIGSSREIVISQIKKILEEDYKYEVQVLKLSKYIEQYKVMSSSAELGKTLAYTSLMNKIVGGDELRKEYGFSVLAEIAINDIHISRHSENGVLVRKSIEDLKSRRKCFIIDSLKNKEELDLLREVYKDIFYFFSIFSPYQERKLNLSKKGLSPDEIIGIIETDNFENNSHGQNVKDTFISGDFFVRISKENEHLLADKIGRYLSIIFENNISTPFPHEIAMYEAQSAAGNSACLSRQVGAAITNERGEIISRGWNDVPKFGGNLYKEGDNKDSRCKHAGYCRNDRTKDIVTDDILALISADDFLKTKLFNNGEPDEKVHEKIKKIIRKSSRVKDLIEFSRSVHAEMHAIIVGSQLAGGKMIGGKLFCTTYPCHNCARHIIVAGIREIFYIEPYSKSLCLSLHEDAITEDEDAEDKVKLLLYDGVAPRRYMEFFLMRAARKDDTGKMIQEFPNEINPKSRLSLQALPTLEQQAIHSLYERGLITEI